MLRSSGSVRIMSMQSPTRIWWSWLISNSMHAPAEAFSAVGEGGVIRKAAR
ncbi:hypothetical protein V2K60_22195 [Pseudomonas alliivorans]|nr:hypothetical protein [Pseudomonas alliivorans]